MKTPRYARLISVSRPQRVTWELHLVIRDGGPPAIRIERHPDRGAAIASARKHGVELIAFGPQGEYEPLDVIAEVVGLETSPRGITLKLDNGDVVTLTAGTALENIRAGMALLRLGRRAGLL